MFEKFKARDHAELVQARKALSDHMFGQVAAGETDEHKLAVAGLPHLNRWRGGRKSLSHEDQIPFRKPHRRARGRLSFPGDLDLTLNWKPETDLTVVPSDDEISSHMLVNGSGKVHVIAAGESWPVKEVRSVLKEG